MSAEKGEDFVDLHVHTVYSDGTFTPEEVVERALKLHLRAIAITDHDCIDGVSPAIKAAEGSELEVIPGIEISAAKDDAEIHILGYFVDWENPSFAGILRRMQSNRIDRMRKMVKCLNEEGVKVDIDTVLGSAPAGAVGRLHLARVMYEEGFVNTMNQAFDVYIGDGKPCHVRHKRLDYKKAINIIKEAGGVPVLAHPGMMGSDEFIPDYVKDGLRGIEVFYTEHDPARKNNYLKMAEDFGLIVTGGSDCHGTKKGKATIGKIKVGYDVVEKLREESEKIRNG